MAEKKPTKVFDVAKPGKGKIDIGSKPMIIGHKTMAADPMMRSESATASEKDTGAPPIKKAPSEVKLKIEPVSDEMKSAKVLIQETDTESENSDNAVSSDESTPPNIDTKNATLQDISADSLPGLDAETPKTEKPQKHMDVAVVSKTTEAKEKPSDTQSDAGSTIESAESDVTTAKDEAAEEKQPDADDAKPSEEPKKTSEKLDPAVIAMERAENLQKIIDSKQYRLDIHESSVEPGGQRKIIVVLAAIFVLLLGLYALVDMKILDIGVDVPVSLFGNDEVVDPPAQQAAAAPSPQPAAAKEQTSESTEKSSSKNLEPDTTDPNIVETDLLLTKVGDEEKIPDPAQDSFRAYIRTLLTTFKCDPPEGAGIAIKRISKNVVFGGMLCDGGHASYWYQSGSTWKELATQDVVACKDLIDTKIPSDFIATCIEDMSANPQIEKPNPNGKLSQ